jgi:hypothetical protein
MIQRGGIEMSFQVVHADQWDITGKGERLAEA